MIGNSSMFRHTDIMSYALDATWKRNTVISQNLANVDTPGYKRKEVDFEEYMSRALKTQSKAEVTGLKRIEPKVYEENSNLSYRLDKNNVDVDTEMVYLAENQIRYNTLTSQVNYDFQRLKSVLK